MKRGGAGREPSGKDEKGQEKVEAGTRGDDEKFTAEALMRKRSTFVVRRERVGFLLSEQFDVAAQGNRGHEVFRFTDLAAEQLRSKAKRKF